MVISTPDHWHALQTIMACAAGKDVYVEKPMTLFVKEGRWMTTAARKYKRIVCVGTQGRSGSHMKEVHAAVPRRLRRQDHQRALHAPIATSCRASAGPPIAIRPPGSTTICGSVPLPQRPYNPNRCLYHFRWFWDYSGGQMTNLGAHDMDLVHFLLGVKAPKSVSSAGGRFALEDNGETPDTQDAIWEYDGFTVEGAIREAGGGRTSRRYGGQPRRRAVLRNQGDPRRLARRLRVRARPAHRP